MSRSRTKVIRPDHFRRAEAAYFWRAAKAAERRGHVVHRGEFVWRPSHQVTVRSRSATGIPAERICPEEYREAVLTVLRSGHGLVRPHLTSEVRSLLGFNRTGSILEEQIAKAIEGLVGEGVLGESSAGIVLRT